MHNLFIMGPASETKLDLVQPNKSQVGKIAFKLEGFGYLLTLGSEQAFNEAVHSVAFGTHSELFGR